MTVIPIGPALAELVLIGKGLTGLDPRETYPWNTIHVEWHENPVPMDRGGLGHIVSYPNRYRVALAKPGFDS